MPRATRIAVNGNSTHEIVGDYDYAAGNTHGFVLNKGVFTTIDAPRAEGGTIITGVNASGPLAGIYFDGAGTAHGFFENKGYFTTLDPSGSIRTQVGFIQRSSQVVGTYRNSTPSWLHLAQGHPVGHPSRRRGEEPTRKKPQPQSSF